MEVSECNKTVEYQLHFVGLRSDDEREQLVSEADTEKRLGTINTNHLPHVVDGGLTTLGVPGAVTDEQAVKIYGRQQSQTQSGGRADTSAHRVYMFWLLLV